MFIEFFETEQYIRAEKSMKARKSFTENVNFFALTNFIYEAGLENNEEFYESEEYEKIINKLKRFKAISYDSFYYFIWTVFEMGKKDRFKVFVPVF